MPRRWQSRVWTCSSTTPASWAGVAARTRVPSRANELAPICIIRALAPKMVEKGEGYIIDITDVEAHHSGPHHAAYAASTYALRGFSHACYEALRPHGIKVVDIAPGNISHTGMYDKSDMAGGQDAIKPQDVVEAVMLAFRLSKNAVPEEVVIKALGPRA